MECDEILDLIKREMSDDITEVIGFRDKTTIFIEKLKNGKWVESRIYIALIPQHFDLTLFISS